MADLLVTVGPPAHGGHCVARLEDGPDAGRVVFVRHALPGERVRLRVTDDSKPYWRADAVEVLSPSADRVAAPCPFAGPGRCGGCDWQHASGPAQRAIKAAVVREQFARLARIDVDPVVEELPGGLLGWRTRTRYAVDAAGRVGLRKHRTHDVQVVDHCPIGAPRVGNAPELLETWPGTDELEVVRGDDDAVSVLAHGPSVHAPASQKHRPERRSGMKRRPVTQVVHGPERVEHTVLGRTYEIGAGGFWQVHHAAAEAFVRAVLELAAPHPGERLLDLYAGAGLFTAPLAEAVGPTGRVDGIEGSRPAAADAESNLADLPWASVRHAPVSPATLRGHTADVVVLDPPRVGAGRDVMTAILDTHPRVVVYVACDPAALARDVRTALDAGWRLGELRAFDSFPMTHHVECVAAIRPS